MRAHFDLHPRGIIQMLDLLRPNYSKTAAYGDFGRDEPEFSWKRTDKAAALRAAAWLKQFNNGNHPLFHGRLLRARSWQLLAKVNLV